MTVDIYKYNEKYICIIKTCVLCAWLLDFDNSFDGNGYVCVNMDWIYFGLGRYGKNDSELLSVAKGKKVPTDVVLINKQF